MSKADTLRPSRTPIIAVPTARSRGPVPPSPLSQISPSGTHHQANPLSTQQISESSPCFIHSHLDRHGSLQDWLKTKSSSAPAAPVTHYAHTHTTHAQIPRHVPSTASSSKASGRESSSGYDSDRSSSNVIDGDLDDEETASLTKQLAETAQGVREMSKELGGSLHVQADSRPYTGTITYPTCPYRYESSGQPPYPAHSGTRHLPHAEETCNVTIIKSLRPRYGGLRRRSATNV
jgi:hypothetical protein